MKLELTAPPYALDALEPHISRSTLELHYGKHHRAYVEKTRALVSEGDLTFSSLEDVVRRSHGKRDLSALFNNAAQAWNHAFFWRSLRPGGGGRPAGKIGEKIQDAFGSFETFAREFEAAATGRFGSGWAWLVLDREDLRITTTSNADTPIVEGHAPLLVIDVWEHAYYLDYQNRRAQYVSGIIQHLFNWDFAEQNFMHAHAAAAELN